MTLTDFLLARLAEDEAVAKAAQGKAWTMLRHEGLGDRMADEDVNAFARHNLPARVLADVEAKRRIVIQHMHYTGTNSTPADECMTCESDEPWPCTTIRLLALPYADHPDFDPTWRA